MRMEFACLLKMCFLCWIHFYISNGSWEIHLSAICQQSNITNYSRHTLLPFLRRKKNVCLLHSFNETMLSLDNNIVYEEKTTYILAQNNAYSIHTKKYFCWILLTSYKWCIWKDYHTIYNSIYLSMCLFLNSLCD